MTITAAADGSALGNPGPAGWAWYVNNDCWRAGGWPHGTNNQGELMAVLDLFRATAHVPQEDLHILCDSQYVINCITKWMPGWKRKGWRKADGKPVLNVDLLKDIDRELVGRKYRFEWVRGHAGHDLNEAADERARAVALAYQQGIAARSGPGFHGAAALGAPDVGAADVSAQGSVASAAGPGSVAVASRPGSAVADVRKEGGTGPYQTEEPGLFSEPEQDRFSEPEPDLFSELDADAFPVAPGRGPSPEETVEALERELLRPDVRSDIGRTGVLLHPEFMEIGSSGRIWTRDAMMMSLEESPGGPMELELISADRIGADTILLTYRSRSRDGAALRSSVWVLHGGQWRLRFHQGTPEA
ncbi:RNase H family protein [Arthrobacter sp. NPDC093139]|uniref:RNase H family protein n=1 Tax=Arthrobacter sp. NPDC093139 TaxID=3363945 RepID=UPI0037F55C6F